MATRGASRLLCGRSRVSYRSVPRRPVPVGDTPGGPMRAPFPPDGIDALVCVLVAAVAGFVLGRRRAAPPAEEERFRRLFEDSPLGIYRTTPDGRILLANPACVRMSGCSTFEELAAHNLERDGTHSGYPRAEFK